MRDSSGKPGAVGNREDLERIARPEGACPKSPADECFQRMPLANVFDDFNYAVGISTPLRGPTPKGQILSGLIPEGQILSGLIHVVDVSRREIVLH